MIEILPSSLYSLPNIEIIFTSKTSSIIHKSLSQNLVNKKMYLSSVAILLVTKGEQVIRNYDGDNLVVKENEMVVLPKDLYVVSDFVTNQNIFEAMIFFIDDQLIKKFLLFYSINKKTSEISNKIIKVMASNQIKEYIHSLRTTCQNKKINNSLSEIKIIEFLLLAGTQDDTKLFMSSLIFSKKRRGIKQFMEDNYLSNLKIYDYAILTGRSVSTFTREFKRLYGTNPNKWLIKKRLKKSHDLLNDTNMNVTQVSMEVGYENISHFIKAYKEVYGVTPKLTKNITND